MKQVKTTLILIFLVNIAFAQNFGGPSKGSAIGFSGNLVDFSASVPKIGKVDPGFSLMYWKGISSHFDFSLRYNGLFTDYTKDKSKINDYTNEFEGSLHARFLTNDHLFNPFLTAGIGIGNYGKSVWAPYVPLGGGLQANLFNEGYIFLQANYRASLDYNKLDNNMFYSLGFTQNLRATHAKEVVAPLPVPPPPPVVVDRDGDGVPDSTDKCPDVAGLASLNGCPDSDGDGIPDYLDKCPTVKGLAKYQGCPIPDTDGDGINDEEDKCPTVAGVARYGGCPIPDTDGDGVNDEVDKCPNVPGPADNAGCPIIGIDAYKVIFKSGSSVLLPDGKKELDKAVAYLKKNEGFDVMIEGHTDNTGSAKINNALSQKRADAVKAYFVKNGVKAERLFTQGFGSTTPVADNKTAEGRKHNRRIEVKLKK